MPRTRPLLPPGLLLRLLLHGGLAGALLSCMRAPLGLDWTQVQAVQGSNAALFRAAALLALALSMDPARAAFRAGAGTLWLAALALGFGGHAFFAPGLLQPTGRIGFGLTVLLATLVLRALAGPRGAPDPGPLPAFPVLHGSLARSERLGLVLIGMGLALGLQTLSRELRLLTPGPGGDAVDATTFLVLLFVGALAFGPLARRLGPEGLRTRVGLALACGATLAGLVFLRRLGPEGLHPYLMQVDSLLEPLRRLDASIGHRLRLDRVPPIDGATIGLLWTSTVIALGAFVVPAFLVGATLGAAGHGGRAGHALVGGALGLCIEPQLIARLARPLGAGQWESVSWSWSLLVAASVIAALGLALSTLPATGRERWIGLGCALLAAGLPWLRPRLVLWSFSPWNASDIVPDLVFPTPEGLVTVERARDGGRIVTLDRARWTPVLDEERVDEQRLRFAWSLLDEGRRQGRVRALLVGQLTPERSRVLASLGTIELDRTTPWPLAQEAVDALLFEDGPAPLGRVVRPGEARRRLRAGEYDWVLVPPVHGAIVLWKMEARDLWGSVEAPRLDSLSLGEHALGVVWVQADSTLARTLGPERVIHAWDHLDSLSVGILRGEVADDAPLARTVLSSGEPVEPTSPLGLLATLPQRRTFRLEDDWCRRLDAAGNEGPAGSLAHALAIQAAAQQLSSPYETRAEQVELQEDFLRALLKTVPPEGPLDPFTYGLWEDIAWLVTEKRKPDLAISYLEPLAERFDPWPAIDLALARAWRELLEPAEALPYLERALEQDPLNIGLLSESAACCLELGDRGRASAFLERGLAIQPGRPDLERALGLILAPSGDEHGLELLRRALARDPEDAEVLRALEAPQEGPPAPESPPGG